MQRYSDPAADPMPLLRETAFQDLMQRRIFNVLLIASPYDTFMLEEDGRVEEQVYMEYMGLNLSSAPRFTKAATFDEALQAMASQRFDLIIAMPGVDISETFTAARAVKMLYPDIPFVVLTPFSREVRRTIEGEDLSAVDYVFSWLGNVDLIVAIIKLIEDKMNAEADINGVGVQTIILVEDSIRFYSAALPYLYRFLLTQSMAFSTEALNDHERMLRMRGRPKVLLARDYEEATRLYTQFAPNILGVISDVSYPRGGVTDTGAGVRLAGWLKGQDPFLPVILQSSETDNRRAAAEAGAIFLDKNSKSYPQDLRDTVSFNLGFGSFVVHDPKTGRPLMDIANLNELQKKIFDIPADALYEHCSHNDFSRWLQSRAIFPIATALRSIRFTDMSQAPAVRQLIFDCIVRYRRMKNRGVVAIFRKDRFDSYSNFARIGQGSLGGKGRGLAFIDTIIKRHPECDSFQGARITIPRTVVLCTDVFDRFMDHNHLYPVALSDHPDAEILETFLGAELPTDVDDDLRAVATVMGRPMAIRSSSLLEDSHYQPFAGVYSTYMIPSLPDIEQTLRLLRQAVKGVYASVFFAESKAYMNATQNVIDQEKMAVIIQEVAGRDHGDYYYPTLSGVGRSIDYYPLKGQDPDDGVAEVAAGLGKYIVDGGKALRFSPLHPDHVLQTSTLQLALRDTQTTLDALPLTPSDADTHFKADDGFNIRSVPIAEAARSGALNYLLSTYDAADERLRDTPHGPGRKVVTFAGVLHQGVFPLADAISFMLRTGQTEMGRPVEIEFAADIAPDANTNPEAKGTIYWLQMRPIVDRKEMLDQPIDNSDPERIIVSADTALGHGLTTGVATIVYVRPQEFSPMLNTELAAEIDRLNTDLTAKGEPYVLIGPGRWGSSDKALGIPVKWTQIAGARVIVEASLPGYRIEPSQGTHFFQNLTQNGVAYLTVDASAGHGTVNYPMLDSMQAQYESEHLRVVRFAEPLTIAVNSRRSSAVILTPAEP